MYERILVAVDGSPVSDRALVEAAKLAQLSGGELRVITIIDSPLRHLPDYAVYYNPEPLREAALKAADDILAKAKDKIAEFPVKTSFERVCQERASEEIAERIEIEAEGSKADIIVMGTHGRRGVRRLMLGSVAEGLLRVSNRPVLLVREK
ncbi:universal stress protein [Pseudomonas sp. PDM18]|uniref:universal stress protein n=1 Tax=Pseudomonas sp. PDM18 TaxID=2769253 RepID=UPI00177F3680|nr:universal stress protein [Pseudomonas sp. PDM18]MBD9675723.1 universal stress protein [Pseudomonas sp. PDM18]